MLGKIRFGFVVSEEMAKKLYVLLRESRKKNIRSNLTSVFEGTVDYAYQALPKEAQDLTNVVLPDRKETF